MLGVLFILIKKDLRHSVEGGHSLQACLLGLVCIFLFSMAGAPPTLAAALFCLVSLLAATIILPALYRQEQNCLGPLLALGLSPQYIWMSKAAACFLLLSANQIIFYAAISLFMGSMLPEGANLTPSSIASAISTQQSLQISLTRVWQWGLGIILLNWGLCCAISLLTPIHVNTNPGQASGQSALGGTAVSASLPALITIPLCVPLLIKGTSALRAVYVLPPQPVPSHDLLFMLGFDLIISAITIVLFPFVLESNRP